METRKFYTLLKNMFNLWRKVLRKS